MQLIDEETAASLVTIDDAIDAVRSAFLALDDGRAELFRVTGGAGSDPANRVAVKSARLDGIALGVKVGTYWPDNVTRGEVAHASTVLLLDDATGFPLAVVGASHLTALRTAAVDAVAVDALAPRTASTLAVVGTGHQAFYDALAISRVRELADVAVWGRRADRAEALVDRLVEEGLPARVADSLAEATKGATILTTVTSAHEPLLDLETVGSVAALAYERSGERRPA
jgi:ornithine cyclodeaminase